MKNAIHLKSIKFINGEIELPGSKSISNRVLLLAAQALGTTKLINLLDSDDVRYMLFALKTLGINYRISDDKKNCEIDGIGQALFTKNDNTSLFLGNSGTSMRSLTAALSLQKHTVILTGDSRMCERPINHLVDALCQGGGRIDYMDQHGYPPLKLYGGYNGGKIVIHGNISSQFLSGILMAAPLAHQDSCIQVDGMLVSRPYIDMTLAVMKDFGIKVMHNNYQYFYCEGGKTYQSPGDYFIEGDASSASYFLAAAAIRGGLICVKGVGRNSIQGDIYCADVLESMGATIYWGNNYIECERNKLCSVDMDMNHIPDAAMTVAVVALFVSDGMPTILRNIYNWRVKETDRLTGMTMELQKVGGIVVEGNDYLKIMAPKKIQSAEINTYNDHRMAMAFSLVALSNSSVTILNPTCVNKTFPNFFEKFLSISRFE